MESVFLQRLLVRSGWCALTPIGALLLLLLQAASLGCYAVSGRHSADTWRTEEDCDTNRVLSNGDYGLMGAFGVLTAMSLIMLVLPDEDSEDYDDWPHRPYYPVVGTLGMILAIPPTLGFGASAAAGAAAERKCREHLALESPALEPPRPSPSGAMLE